jgi:hypothetical protein
MPSIPSWGFLFNKELLFLLDQCYASHYSVWVRGSDGHASIASNDKRPSSIPLMTSLFLQSERGGPATI